MRLQYPTNVRIVRVPCTGKVDVIHIMRSFEKGADGVAVDDLQITVLSFCLGEVRQECPRGAFEKLRSTPEFRVVLVNQTKHLARQYQMPEVCA